MKVGDRVRVLTHVEQPVQQSANRPHPGEHGDVFAAGKPGEFPVWVRFVDGRWAPYAERELVKV